MTDWNWFFSSFSQSAAALLGIIGAFVISRLVGLNEKIQLADEEFQNLRIRFQNIRRALDNRNFSWYNQMRLQHYTDLHKSIAKGNYRGMSNEEILAEIYGEYGAHLYKHDTGVLSIFAIIDAEEAKPGLMPLRITPNGLTDSMVQERESINSLAIESLGLIASFANSERTSNRFFSTLFSLRIIIILLCIAFPITVIYPLHFMPMGPNEVPSIGFSLGNFWDLLCSIRGGMLFIFLLTIEAIFIYFLRMIQEQSALIATLLAPENHSFQNPENYSPHVIWSRYS